MVSFLPARALGAVMLLGLSACTVTEENWEMQFADASCAALSRCDLPNADAWPSFESCAADLGEVIRQTDVDYGLAGCPVDLVAVRRCVRAVRGPCDAYYERIAEPCDHWTLWPGECLIVGL